MTDTNCLGIDNFGHRKRQMREREKEKQTEREVEAASEGCGSSFTLVASERAQSEAQGPRLE